MLTSALIVSKHPQDEAGPCLGAYIAACSMPWYLHASSHAFSNSAMTVAPVTYKVSFHNWPCTKLCWYKPFPCLHSLPLWELAVSMQEKQAVPLRVLPPKVHLSGPSWLRTDDLQNPVSQLNFKLQNSGCTSKQHTLLRIPLHPFSWLSQLSDLCCLRRPQGLQDGP